jgi:methionine biosynthesis protein MetW
VLVDMLRIGRRVAVSLPNFGYWKVRASLLTQGKMPRTRALDYHWYDTPNIHLCTLSDFVDLAQTVGATIVEAHALDVNGNTRRMQPHAVNRGYLGPNFSAPGAIFLLKKS